MNERTEALAKQAAEYAIEFATQDQELYIPKLMEKFAELIIRECMEQVWYTREEKIDETIIPNIKTRMAKLFGVEE